MKELVIEMEDECIDCPNLSLETKEFYADDFFGERVIKTHQCKHLYFCKEVRTNWEKHYVKNG